MSDASITSTLNQRFPVVSGGQPMPMNLAGAVASEVNQARTKTNPATGQLYTDEEIANAIGGLMANKAKGGGALLAWNTLSSEGGLPDVMALFPNQGSASGASPVSGQNPLDGANVDQARRWQAFFGIDKRDHRIEDGDYQFSRNAFLDAAAASATVPAPAGPPFGVGAWNGKERRAPKQAVTGRRVGKTPVYGDPGVFKDVP